MTFILLVLLAALMIEGIGTYMSVIGLAALFASNPVIIVMAVALDVGKVVTVSFLYRNWKKVNLIMKSYMTIAALTLILITSAGVFGYLSAEFQKAIQGTSENTVLVEAMEDEKSRLQARKIEIDSQIAAIPPDFVTGRRQAIEAFADEVQRINARLIVIDTELPPLKLDSIKKEVEVGPIMYIAEAFSVTPEIAVKYIIMTIIFVFDPLAIALLVAGNFLLVERQKAKLGIKDSTAKISLADSFGTTWSVPPVVAPTVESPPVVEEIETPDEDLRPAGAVAEINDDTTDHDADSWHEEFGGALAVDEDDVPEVDAPHEVLPAELSPTEREVITRDRLLRYPAHSAFEGIGSKSDVFEDDLGGTAVPSAVSQIYRNA